MNSFSFTIEDKTYTLNTKLDDIFNDYPRIIKVEPRLKFLLNTNMNLAESLSMLGVNSDEYESFLQNLLTSEINIEPCGKGSCNKKR